MSRQRQLCQTCGEPVAVTTRGRLWNHGRPVCPASRKPWHPPNRWAYSLCGRRIITIPGPDTWNLEGAA